MICVVSRHSAGEGNPDWSERRLHRSVMAAKLPDPPLEDPTCHDAATSLEPEPPLETE